MSALELIESYVEKGITEKIAEYTDLESGGLYESNADYSDEEFSKIFIALATITGRQLDTWLQ